VACTAPYAERFHDNSIDMGTGFDCMDVRSHPDNTAINATGYYHRMLLQHLMVKHGFQPYPQEWWHFTLKNEPFPDIYFNFVVE
jgi:D-alanyl-D-alanine dipeptidase